jgi:hypothetical protein
MFQNIGHFSRFEAVRARLALVSHVSFAVQNVEAIRPSGVSDLSGVGQVVGHRRDFERELGQARFGQLAALLEVFGAGHPDILLEIVLVLPSVHGMGFHDVNHEESRLSLVLFIEFVERGNLPAEGWSGVAAENQHHGLVPAK